jgi:xanthosine utilization system XapX-like protein
MLNTVVAFVVGLLVGLFIALSYPAPLHHALAKVGLGSVEQSASTSTK